MKMINEPTQKSFDDYLYSTFRTLAKPKEDGSGFLLYSFEEMQTKTARDDAQGRLFITTGDSTKLAAITKGNTLNLSVEKPSWGDQFANSEFVRSNIGLLNKMSISKIFGFEERIDKQNKINDQ